MGIVVDKVRALGVASMLVLFACGPQSGNGDGGGSEVGEDGGNEAPGSDAADDEAPQPDSSGGDESTGAEPMAPES